MSVDADIDANEDFWGYNVSDLQENITIEGKAIRGTLKYIDDYSSAFGTGEDSGNYLAIHCEVPDVEDVTITAEVVNGVHGPVTLDSDGLVVVRVADKNLQTIKVVASKSGFDSVEKIYRLSGLTCEPSGASG